MVRGCHDEFVTVTGLLEPLAAAKVPKAQNTKELNDVEDEEEA